MNIKKNTVYVKYFILENKILGGHLPHLSYQIPFHGWDQTTRKINQKLVYNYEHKICYLLIFEGME